MAILKSNKTGTLTLRDQVQRKAIELRLTQEDQAQAAEDHLRASAAARSASDTSAAHALAVEQALTILDEAGVEL